MATNSKEAEEASAASPTTITTINPISTDIISSIILIWSVDTSSTAEAALITAAATRRKRR